MNRIYLIVLVAALCGCRGGNRPYVHAAPDPIRETGAPTAPAGAPETPPASHERPSEAPGIRSTALPAKPDDVASRDPTVVIVQLNRQLKDAFFDYDRSAMRADAIAALRQDAALLLPIIVEFPQLKVTVEGHCDERGSAEYNLGLGDHRAGAAEEVLRGFGVPSARLETVSYGRERPQCTELTESCWRQNRRAHLVVRAPGATD
jgi:peptidoglycan-associated lipoprotein